MTNNDWKDAFRTGKLAIWDTVYSASLGDWKIAIEHRNRDAENEILESLEDES